jgi:hypothetical protein
MNLIERVKAILLTPKTEWPVIAREPNDMVGLFRNYVGILAAIPAVCGFIGTSLIGVNIPGSGTVTVPIAEGLMAAIVGYVMSLVSVYVMAYIADLLAPTFGMPRNFDNAMKLAAYSFTPSWLAGIFSLVPALSFLAVLGLYGLYLLYTGVTPLMKAPADKALPYTGALVVCAIVLGVAISVLLVMIMAVPSVA